MATHTLVLVFLYLVLWLLIQMSHLLFPQQPLIVFYLEVAAEFGLLLLFVIWTVFSIGSYMLSERKKIKLASLMPWRR